MWLYPAHNRKNQIFEAGKHPPTAIQLLFIRVTLILSIFEFYPGRAENVLHFAQKQRV